MDRKIMLIALLAITGICAMPLVIKEVLIEGIAFPFLITLSQQMALFTITFFYLEFTSPDKTMLTLPFKAQLKYILPLAIAELAYLLLLNNALLREYPSFVAMVSPLSLAVQCVVCRLFAVGTWNCRTCFFVVLTITGVVVVCSSGFQWLPTVHIVLCLVCLGVKNALLMATAANHDFFHNHLAVTYTTIPWTLALSFIAFLMAPHETVRDLISVPRRGRLVFVAGAFIVGQSLFMLTLAAQRLPQKHIQWMHLMGAPIITIISWLLYGGDAVDYIRCAGFVLAAVGGFELSPIGAEAIVYVDVGSHTSKADEKIVLGRDSLDSLEDENDLENVDDKLDDALSLDG